MRDFLSPVPCSCLDRTFVEVKSAKGGDMFIPVRLLLILVACSWSFLVLFLLHHVVNIRA